MPNSWQLKHFSSRMGAGFSVTPLWHDSHAAPNEMKSLCTTFSPLCMISRAGGSWHVRHWAEGTLGLAADSAYIAGWGVTLGADGLLTTRTSFAAGCGCVRWHETQALVFTSKWFFPLT